METSGSSSYIESKKNTEYFKSSMYERIGHLIMSAAERRKRKAMELEAMQQR